MPTASLHITKLAAAKRQLQAAIRLYFMQEDDLAIHSVAAASYGILKDLKNDRGMNEAADVTQAGIFYVVRDFRRGTLPTHLTSDPAALAEIQRMADDFSTITADSNLSDFRITIPSSLQKFYWRETNRTANFLKHADQDSDRALPLDAVDNRLLLMKSMSAYRDIAPDDLGKPCTSSQSLAF